MSLKYMILGGYAKIPYLKLLLSHLVQEAPFCQG